MGCSFVSAQRGTRGLAGGAALATLVALAATVGACGSRTSTRPPPAPDDDGPDPTPAPEQERDRGAGFREGVAADGAAAMPHAVCATAERVSAPRPLALHFVVDGSASMKAPTAKGGAKWDALSRAITTFAESPRSRGVHVALEVFPRRSPAVLPSCQLRAVCREYVPCAVRVCDTPGSLRLCSTSTDCKGKGTCQPLGVCNGTGALCTPTDPTSCPPGACIVDPAATCPPRDDCRVESYVAPDVELGPLPAGASAVARGLRREPDGDTPLGPALEGAVRYLAEATLPPSTSRALVLLTDGFPTSCGTTTEPLAATAARARAEHGLRTFVVGVFAPEERAVAEAELGRVAAAGDTARPLVLDDAKDLGDALGAALEAIRGDGIGCRLPLAPPEGAVLDGAAVVELRGGTADERLPQVPDRERCGDALAFYVEPATQGVTAAVQLCPAACQVFSGQADRLVVATATCAPPEDGVR